MYDNYPEITKISDQTDRYSPCHAHFWQDAISGWSDSRKRAVCKAIRSLESSYLVSGRVAKIIAGYNDGPIKNTPILVFGEVPPGGGDFKKGTNELIFSLDGTVYWRNPFSRGRSKKIEIKECESEACQTKGNPVTE